MVKELRGGRSAEGRRVGIVVSRWNELVTQELLRGCLDELAASGNPEVTVVHVPGSWEIPMAVSALIQSSTVHGVVALGCILQGATNHAAMLAGDTAGALMSQQLASGVPVSWGVLTPENQEQALERSGMKVGHKGREAASALVEMMSLLQQIRGK
jgi:6,7-dimethyl-8-ribityllumazine synthase